MDAQSPHGRVFSMRSTALHCLQLESACRGGGFEPLELSKMLDECRCCRHDPLSVGVSGQLRFVLSIGETADHPVLFCICILAKSTAQPSTPRLHARLHQGVPCQRILHGNNLVTVSMRAPAKAACRA
jgi:hypothetical protein